MPIYEYACRSCGSRFELLVLGSTTPTCPSCHGSELDRVLSLSSVSSAGVRRRSFTRARERRRKTHREQAIAEQDTSHDHDHDDDH